MNTTGYATAAGSLGSGSSISNVKASQPNFADTVNLANDKVAQLVGRLANITDRLCGSVPMDANSNGPVAVPNGLLDEVMSKAINLSILADAGNDLLNRIERALP